MTEREKSFSASHRGLRNVLGQFSMLAGRTNYGDPAEVAALKTLGREMLFFLAYHGRSENTHLLPLLESRAPGAGAADYAEHEQLATMEHSLGERLEALDGTQNSADGHEFYLDFTEYHSRYLAHIRQEELITDKLLQTHFSDEELRTNRVKKMMDVAFDEMLVSVKYIVPAQWERASVGLLTGVKKSLSAEQWEAIVAALRTQMSEERVQRLLAQL